MSRYGSICSTFATPLVLLLIAAPAVRAEEPSLGQSQNQDGKTEKAKDNKFKQGEVTVVVTGKQEPIETANTRIDAKKIQEFNRDTVATSLALLPGVSTSMTGGRNEQTIYVRGNDSRQVPVFVDGVPAYVPYDGLMDYARFTTFDLSEIQIAKGFSSIAYGANTLGGAINLVTRRPSEHFEGDARVGVSDGNGRKVAVNAGTNQGLWYLQGGGSYSAADTWKMSSNFVPNAREDGGRRENSDYSDKKYSMKAGFTPNDQDEYAVGVTKQRGKKGNPVSTDLSTGARYWRWPYWDKDSAFITTNTALGNKSYVKFRAYYDSYQNSILDYTDNTDTVIKTNGSLKPTGKSRYDDFTHGLMLEVGTQLLPNHSLKGMIQTKTDVHREDDYSRPSTTAWSHYEDRYLSYGVEDTVTLTNTLDLSLGLGWDRLKPEKSGPTFSLPDSKSYLHGQIGLFWKVTPEIQVYGTIAQKDHFPTLKDRYSQRLATFIENPSLKPELSTNYELGTKANPNEWLQVEAALFQSDIRDLIQSVTTTVPLTTPPGYFQQMQNIGKVQSSGVELSVGLKPNQYIQTGLGYTYLDRTNRSNSTQLTGTPKQRVTGYFRLEPVKTFYILASIQAQDALWDINTNTTRLGGFATTDLTLGWQATPKLLVDGGMTNLFDRNYQLNSGYPSPGRALFANARYHF